MWAGAGTHDIGFDRDQRNNGVTHKIDPNTDGERDYIRDSLVQTGMVVKTDYITPTDPVTSAKTATGSGFTSDGRTVLVYLSDDVGNVSAGFSDVFCSVLKQKNPAAANGGHAPATSTRRQRKRKARPASQKNTASSSFPGFSAPASPIRQPSRKVKRP